MFLTLNHADFQIAVKSMNYNYLPSNDEPPRLSIQLEVQNLDKTVEFLTKVRDNISFVGIYEGEEVVHEYNGSFVIDGLSEDISKDHHALELVLLKQ